MNTKTSLVADKRAVIHIRSASTIYDKVKRMNALTRQKKIKEEK